MLQATISPPNAILFVFDPANKNVIIPAYVDGELTAANDTCVSVGTQADVDGETDVSLGFFDEAPVGLQQVFLGTIHIPSGRVGIVTSQFQRVLELEVPIGPLAVMIWADDLRMPARIAVQVKPE
ncbi:hypothetical protein GCM10027277_30130 [Pseudoduganella ginsengisoli]|uniref:Uncharacterized protein n=1 Tax=Pseudoduganella ginsengisoli TaxID=1462440 RepID=A0A6L6Q108_9BURK|nr:hypothetical protein [Pseudoduganella ginsengisoli]MTW03114.1 hypothetical protein [Pseudoduganella ginsengisoli]